jgi:hypothetical protein
LSEDLLETLCAEETPLAELGGYMEKMSAGENQGRATVDLGK